MLLFNNVHLHLKFFIPSHQLSDAFYKTPLPSHTAVVLNLYKHAQPSCSFPSFCQTHFCPI